MAGSYDHARRRKSQRRQRQRGCSVYIAAEELIAAGYSPDEPPPYFRVWSAPKGRLRLQLYRTA